MSKTQKLTKFYATFYSKTITKDGISLKDSYVTIESIDLITATSNFIEKFASVYLQNQVEFNGVFKSTTKTIEHAKITSEGNVIFTIPTPISDTIVEDVIIEDTKSTIKQEELKSIMDRYVYMDTTKKVLEMAYTTDSNVILWGAGGHGKSELTLDFLREKGHEPFVMTMGSGMNTDRLYGGVDLRELKRTGSLHYFVENSFMNHEYVIFEELFDAPDFILEQLKDILSSGIFRNGSQMFPIKTKLIICNTNTSREEFAKNASLHALMERFPLENEVKWKTYNRLTYENLLNTTLGYADPMLTYILEKFAVAKNVISPRIAIKSAQLLGSCGPDCLDFIADFSNKSDLLKESISSFESMFKIQQYSESLAKLKTDISLFDIGSLKDLDTVKEANNLLNKYRTQIAELKTTKADETMVELQATTIKTHEKLYAKYKGEIDKLIKELTIA